MTRGTFVAMALLVSVILTCPAWAVEEGEQSESRDRNSSNQRVRQREGGERIEAERMRADREEGTEEGLPESRLEALVEPGSPGRADRMLVERRWRLGVYAYNTDTGVVITRVMPGSAARDVGFEPGDRIVAVDGYQVGYVGHRVYYLGEELQRRADHQGRVTILAQNVRNNRLLNLDVWLDDGHRPGRPFPMPYDSRERARSRR